MSQQTNNPILPIVHLVLVDVAPVQQKHRPKCGKPYIEVKQDVVAIDPSTGDVLARWSWFAPQPKRNARSVLIAGVKYAVVWPGKPARAVRNYQPQQPEQQKDNAQYAH